MQLVKNVNDCLTLAMLAWEVMNMNDKILSVGIRRHK
jgi:hypothetical protein